MPSVGLYLIAKNEAHRLPRLLKSVEGAFDQVVLVDTGSTDDTISVFKDWAFEQKGLRYTVDAIEWTKDFAAARTRAQGLLDTDWEVWADCDDEIVGAQNIRGIIQQVPDNVAALSAGYNYGQHPDTGQCICYLKRERIVRRGHGHWQNRVHEAQVINGMVQQIPPHLLEWKHCKTPQEQADEVIDARRNLEILEAWIEDEPANTRILVYLGTENMARGETELAMGYFHQYLGLNPEWDEERAQVHRKLAICYLQTGRFDDAIECAFNAMRVMPTWTDSYITLAEAHYAKGEHAKAIVWAREALRIGPPETLLIVNPLDYSYQPRKILSGALAATEQLDEAIQVGAEAWQINPGDQELARAMTSWRAAAKREHTANSVAMLAQQLIHHDEQLKALRLLEECVPHFAEDHPGVVGLRSALRERLAWVPNPQSLLDHYATGGSKPEDFLPEEVADQVAAQLPRVQFLYRGIHEQLVEQHHEGLVLGAQDQIEKAMEALS